MRIAITQRADEVSSHGERRDALDQRWATLLEAMSVTVVPLPNGLKDPQAWANALGIQGLLLSGGNDLCGLPGAQSEAPERDRSERLLLDMARVQQWSVLGVCRGMQMLNTYLGGTITPVAGHVAVRHPVHPNGRPARFLTTLPQDLEVNSFHSFGIAADGLAPHLAPLLHDAQGYVEAVEHTHLRWVAVMWHPERESQLGTFELSLLTRLFKSA